jgi:hypothetical protein
LSPDEISPDLIALAHDRAYVDQVLACAVPREVERRIGLPIDQGVVRRARLSAGGTLLAARLALQHGLAGSTAGGSHHGQRTTGAGFCVFNDVAIAAQVLAREGTITRALIIDLDVHQGDGTADCLSGEPHLFTFSVHAEKNYPVRKIPGDLDVGLDDGVRTPRTSPSCRLTFRRCSTPSPPISCSTMQELIPTTRTSWAGWLSRTRAYASASGTWCKRPAGAVFRSRR